MAAHRGVVNRSAGATRILVAGVGNILRGDDGFGPAVIRALESGASLPEGVRAIEIGIGGFSLVQELLDGYDALVVVDAVERDGPPGSLYVLEPAVPEVEAIPPQARRDLAADMHGAVPARALLIARAAGVLPAVVRLVGCQPGQSEECTMELSAPVQAAVPRGVDAVRAILAELTASQG
jgi:hydrogenase maturation protease